MLTKSQAILDTADQALAGLIRLSGFDHTAKQLNQFLKDVGSEVELFLKDAVYKGTRNRDKFFVLINGLAALGLDQQSRTDLHELRDAYNLAKHEPNRQTTSESVKSVLKNARQALYALQLIGPGDCNQPIVQVYRRKLWMCAWDHYISGDTEISLFLPNDRIDFPISIDFFNIKMDSWDTVKGMFASSGELVFGPEYFPANVYSIWAESDFLAAGVFTGSYRELVKELAQHVDMSIENAILPNLRRASDPEAAHAAVLLSAVDAVAEGFAIGGKDAFTEAITRIATYRYSLQIIEKGYIDLINVTAEMLLEATQNIPHITGPLWVRREDFVASSNEALAIRSAYGIAVSREGELLVALRNA